MRCGDICKVLEELSPVSFAEEWDNVGLLVGDRNRDVQRILIAVDATEDVIEQAVNLHADMIITHHPMIFRGMKKVVEEDFIGRRVLRLASEGIAYYAMHTNFDVMGMADAAADELKLSDSTVLTVTYEDDISKEGIGRVGVLPEMMSLEQCAEYVKDVFRVSEVRVYGDRGDLVKVAAVCPGSGKDSLEDAIKAGADVFITGDITHHVGIDAVARGLSVIDAGHYGVEKLFVNYMRDFLSREISGVTLYTAREQEPFWIV
ncbi:MAG: Nif3-like dinuclear metal center hexameric protein [Lachnospiraceae bacterium]|nr:Nif3-like dinuclear metal center hexameric protein [Lachnospiraceae bacterium]